MVGRVRWLAWAIATWFLAVPTLLGYLAGWAVDRSVAGPPLGRLTLTGLGVVVGLIAARQVFPRRR
jgi:hypothetical protein